MNTAFATQHKNKMFAWIDTAGQDIVVRPPAVRTASTNDAEKIFGVTGSQETDYGTPVTVTAHVHQGKVPSDFAFAGSDPNSSMIGMLAESDLILSLKLEDVLVDAAKPYGRTIIDQAKDIQVSGSTFSVTGTFRSGFAPVGPYILWVGLKNVGE